MWSRIVESVTLRSAALRAREANPAEQSAARERVSRGRESVAAAEVLYTNDHPAEALRVAERAFVEAKDAARSCAALRPASPPAEGALADEVKDVPVTQDQLADLAPMLLRIGVRKRRREAIAALSLESAAAPERNHEMDPASHQRARDLIDVTYALLDRAADVAQSPKQVRRRRLLRAGIAVLFLLALMTPLLFKLQDLYAQRNAVWAAEYFRNTELEGEPAETRFDPEVRFNWRGSGPSSVGADGFSVRWRACLDLAEDSTIAIQLGSDDGARLFFGDEEAIDLWARHAFRLKDEDVELPAGAHPVRVEYFERAGNAKVELELRVNGEAAPLRRPNADGGC